MRATSSSIQGTLGLAVAMGIGRFFYTPLLPLMMAALNWSSSISSWIAVSNYLGYLLGSLTLSKTGYLKRELFIAVRYYFQLCCLLQWR